MEFDWAMVRRQKEWLTRHDCEEADTLFDMLDAIQHAAVEFGEASIEEVFGLVKGKPNG